LESSFSPGPIATTTRFTPSATSCKSPSNLSGTNPKICELRCRHPARWFRAWRLLAHRSDRALFPGDEDGRKIRQERRHGLGICNGFQILLEAGLLPGAMMRNSGLRYICRHVYIRVEQTDTPFTNAAKHGQILKSHRAQRWQLHLRRSHARRTRKESPSRLPLHNADGTNDAAGQSERFPATISRGVCNREATSPGLMPHPERAVESALGSADGLVILRSMVEALVGAAKATA